MTQTVFVVQQVYWEYNDEWFAPEYDTPLKAFTRREQAESYRMAQEREARREICAIPGGNSRWSANLLWTFGDFNNLTSLSEEALQQQVTALGLPEMPDWDDDAHLWWNTTWATLDEKQVDQLWAIFDKIRFYEVEEVEVEQ